jgi:nitroimidazol reductase NimA-like FMN-containing flavoprotein (pyridoxamine 5'-phosphate oxidase superfamily)
MAVDEFTRLRRKDRAMSEDGIRALLRTASFGFTATAVDEQPFLHSSLYWFDETNHRIYFHGAAEGRTRGNVLQNPRVCFSVAEIGRLLPADTALEFSNEYAGVVVFGRARLADDQAEKRRALQGLLDKYFPELHPGVDYRPITEKEMAITTVFAIEIDGWSGKTKRAKQAEQE